MTRRRVLIVTSRFPFPVIGGDRLRVFNLLQQLQRAFDVSLIALGHPPAEDIRQLQAATQIQQVTCVSAGRLRALVHCALALWTGKPLQVAYYHSPELDRVVQEQMGAADACIFHLIRTASSCPPQADQAVVLEMCDAISANFAQTAREGAWWSPWRWISALEAPRTARYERQAAARFDLVSIHTHKDAQTVGIPDHKLLVSTQGVNIARLGFTAPTARAGRGIALIGKMDFFPNRHGAEWFARRVLPALPAGMFLKVIGDCSPKVRDQLARLPGVTVTGRVDSLEAACSDCFCAIAPMHVATGIQNKVLEYFALGLPAVVSPSVASGLLPDGQAVCAVADRETQWADHIRHMDQDRAAFDPIAARALAYAQHSHSWDQIGDEYSRRLNALIDSFNVRDAHQPETT